MSDPQGTLNNNPLADSGKNDDFGALHGDDANGSSVSAPRRHAAGKARGGDASAGLISVQPLRRSEMQPSYAQNLGLEDVEHGFYGSMMNCLGACLGGIGQIPCCLCFPNPYKEVAQGTVGLVSRFGQFYKSVDPGLVQINPLSESLKLVDVKVQVTPVPKQTVMTKDNVNITADSILVWHVSNPYRAAFGISDIRTALIETAQTTLRDVIGSRVLQSVVQDREGVALQVEEIVEETAAKWGVKIESILLKDVLFSADLQQSLSSAATQRRIGESKVIAARSEVDAAVLLRKAADVLSSPAALQIRALEAYVTMSKQAGSKVIFVPTNMGDVSNLSVSALQSGAAGPSGASTAEVAKYTQMADM